MKKAKMKRKAQRLQERLDASQEYIDELEAKVQDLKGQNEVLGHIDTWEPLSNLAGFMVENKDGEIVSRPVTINEMYKEPNL